MIPTYLTTPKGVNPRNLPTVVLPHGGPLGARHLGFSRQAQFLANRGYAVLQPNFRASTGFGKRFLNLGNKQWGTGTMQHDITDGVRWLIQQGIADPRRVAIMGGSYGGFATLAGVTFTPELYAAGVDIVVALREKGQPVEYLVAPDEGHGFQGRENRIAMFAAIERFLAKHLGGRHQPSMAPDIARRLATLDVDVRTVALKPPAPAAAPAASSSGAVVKPGVLH